MLTLFVLLGLTEGKYAPEVIQAERFQLLDAEGRVRGELRMNDGGPSLAFFDEDANNRVNLYHNDDATALYVKDIDGQPRVGAALFSHGGGGFALHGPQGVGASVLYMQGTGPGRLSYYDSTGTETDRFPATD